MGITARPMGPMRSLFKKIENEQIIAAKGALTKPEKKSKEKKEEDKKDKKKKK